MATYFVDGNAGNDSGDGSATRPWKTIGKAEGQVQPGDEVRLRTATYREVMLLRTRNTTWKADTGHTPVIDGRYHDGLFRPDGTLPHPDSTGGFLPPSSNGALVAVREEGIIIDGLTVRNSAGVGFSVSPGNTTIRNCRIDFTYETSIRVNPGASLVDNVVVENNICTRASMKFYDKDRTGTSPQNVSGVIKMGRVRDGIIRNNVCAYGHGEGINIGKGSYRTLVEGNIVHSCLHVHIYVNRSVDVVVRNNLVYHTYNRDTLGINGRPPSGIVMGDENTKTSSWPGSAGGQIYNNIIVGMGAGFGVRNGKNYNTQLNKCYFGYNTIVGGSKSDVGIEVAGNQYNRPHRDSLIENNIVTNVPRMSQVTGDTSGVTFRNNLWSQQPEQSARGPNDRIGDPALVNATAAIRDAYPDFNNNIDPRNYGLTERSTLAIDRGSIDRNFSAFTLPPMRQDFWGKNRADDTDIGAHEFDGVLVVDRPTANFSIGQGQGEGYVRHTVDFIDRSTSARPIVSRLWDFGDGHTSTDTNTAHTYEAAGDYTVTLTIRDDKGQEDTATQEKLISVKPVREIIVPPGFRRFAIALTVDGNPERQALAFGTQFPDMRAILVWHNAPHHMLNFAGIGDVVRSLVTSENTQLYWIDPATEDELVGGDEDEVEEEVESVRVFIPG